MFVEVRAGSVMAYWDTLEISFLYFGLNKPSSSQSFVF